MEMARLVRTLAQSDLNFMLSDLQIMFGSIPKAAKRFAGSTISPIRGLQQETMGV